MVNGRGARGVGGDRSGPRLDDAGLGAFGSVDFGPSLFNIDASRNFERDFAAWFDPENA